MVTAIIPTAGKGTRLGFHPKSLYSIAGRTILDRQIELLKPVCDHFIVIASKDDAYFISVELSRLGVKSADVIPQKEPDGTAEAVKIAMPFLPSDCDYVIVIWGDVVPVDMHVLDHLDKEHAACVLGARALRDNCSVSYVEYLNYEGGREIGAVIMHGDSDDPVPMFTHTDIGIFGFDSDVLKQFIYQYCADGYDIGFGHRTCELHFPPFLMYLSRHYGNTRLVHVPFESTIAVNTPEDAKYAEERLGK